MFVVKEKECPLPYVKKTFYQAIFEKVSHATFGDVSCLFRIG